MFGRVETTTNKARRLPKHPATSGLRFLTTTAEVSFYCRFRFRLILLSTGDDWIRADR